jgi:Tfp pilus assembly protein PilW
MRSVSFIAVGAVVVVLAGCGTLLGIEPDPTPPPNDDGGTPMIDAAPTEAAADAADAADAAPTSATCADTAPFCVLATGLASLGSIAVGAGNVYFARHDAAGPILRVPTNGGAVTTFASPSVLPAGLSATATALYWATGDNQIVRQAFDAATPTTSINGASSPAAQIVGSGSETFWTIPGTGTNGQVRASNTFNAGAGLVINEVFPTAIAADASFVYYASKSASGHVVRMAHNGTMTSTSSIVFSDVDAIAVSGAGTGIVAITSTAGVYRASTQSDATFMSPWIQASPTATAVGLVADAMTGTLYALAADGTLETMPNVMPATSTKMNIAVCGAGTAIAQDDSHVYLACKDTIVRVPK